jgi:membrane-bound serine protease (ClpP class)
VKTAPRPLSVMIFALYLAMSVPLPAQPSMPLTGQADPTPIIIKLTINDVIEPITAEYLQRGVQEATREHAQAILLSLDTPGGLLESTRAMVQTIEQSSVPVIVFVSPSGSRAGSAGFFLLETADIASMAPGTNAGAAHPIVEGRQLDPILKEKIENDTAAFLRASVSRRGRNITAAEDAVRNSKSYSDTEALKLNLIDVIAGDDVSLLTALDGHKLLRFNGSTTSLRLHGAKIVATPPSLRERLLSKLTNPNLAVLLIALGGLLIYLEFNLPGTIVPGTLGAFFVLLGGFGLDLLPLHHSALLLILAALVMIGLEVSFYSHGILAFAGIISLVLGLATLVDGPIPELRVRFAIALAVGFGFGSISVGLGWIALRARRNKVLTGSQAMIGNLAITRTPLSPIGQVEVRGELWQARLEGPSELPTGVVVRIRAVSGLQLVVEPTSILSTDAGLSGPPT